MLMQTGRPSLVEGLLPERLGRNERLERIHAAIDWEPLAGVLAEIHSAPAGRPAYPPLTMLKLALLQQWHDLSDPAMEEAALNNLAFRRFAGFALEDPTPDHSTIARFRARLAEGGLGRAAFAEVNRQLEARGLGAEPETIADATVVGSPARPPAQGGRSERDPEARWTRKNGKWRFGWKVHVGMDRDTGLIRAAELTPANVNDGEEVADLLLSGDEAAFYADKAYDTKARRARLREQGVKDRIMHRANKHHPELPYWKERRNKLIAPLRAPVEAVFGTLKRGYGYERARYLGAAANEVELLLKCMAYNLRRAERLPAPA